MSEKPRVRFCWLCSKKLYGNHHREMLVDEHMRILHKRCAKQIEDEQEDYAADLEPGISTQGESADGESGDDTTEPEDEAGVADDRANGVTSSHSALAL